MGRAEIFLLARRAASPRAPGFPVVSFARGVVPPVAPADFARLKPTENRRGRGLSRQDRLRRGSRGTPRRRADNTRTPRDNQNAGPTSPRAASSGPRPQSGLIHGFWCAYLSHSQGSAAPAPQQRHQGARLTAGPPPRGGLIPKLQSLPSLPPGGPGAP